MIYHMGEQMERLQEGRNLPVEQIIREAQKEMREIKPYYWDAGQQILHTYSRMFRPGKSILAIGDTRVGKTAGRHMYAACLRLQGMGVFSASAEDLGGGSIDEHVTYATYGDTPDLILYDEVAYLQKGGKFAFSNFVMGVREKVGSETCIIGVLPLRWDQSTELLKDFKRGDKAGVEIVSFPDVWTAEETFSCVSGIAAENGKEMNPNDYKSAFIASATYLLGVGIPFSINTLASKLFHDCGSKEDVVSALANYVELPEGQLEKWGVSLQHTEDATDIGQILESIWQAVQLTSDRARGATKMARYTKLMAEGLFGRKTLIQAKSPEDLLGLTAAETSFSVPFE